MLTFILHMHVYIMGHLVCDPEFVMRSRVFGPDNWTLSADLYLTFSVEQGYILLRALRFRPNAPEVNRSRLMLNDINAIVDNNGFVLEYIWQYDERAAEPQ